MSCDASSEAIRGVLDLLHSLGHFRFVGVGTGSTVALFLSSASSFKDSWIIVPSSLDTMMRARELGYNISYPSIWVDFYIDSADEVDMRGVMVKGGGGALLGEKVLSYFSPLNIFAISEGKLVDIVGSSKPIPLEVVRDYLSYIIEEIRSLGFRVEVRESRGKRGPIISDWGGVILDVYTGPVEDPELLEWRLKSIPGVIEIGLFYGFIDYLVVGYRSCGYKVFKFERKRGYRVRSKRE